MSRPTRCHSCSPSSAEARSRQIWSAACRLVMVVVMSGDANQHDESRTADPDSGASADAIPVEVVPGDADAVDLSGLETKLAAAEKEKKENWDRYLRAAADLENVRKRQKREV